MSCCSSDRLSCCRAAWASWFPRIAFGLVFIALGVNHYRSVAAFASFAQAPFAALPILPQVIGSLAYVLPALMIAGGVLLIALNCPVSKACILASLSGIIGWSSLVILVGGDAAVRDMMPNILNASILLILYMNLRRMLRCGSRSGAAPQNV